jgi:hypothetical protein
MPPCARLGTSSGTSAGQSGGEGAAQSSRYATVAQATNLQMWARSGTDIQCLGKIHDVYADDDDSLLIASDQVSMYANRPSGNHSWLFWTSESACGQAEA